MKNRKPPVKATVRWEILVAIIRPPTTANPVHRKWPMDAPTVTPNGFLCVASAIVVTWLRSPHSARKVRTNASIKIGVQKRESVRRNLLFGGAPASILSSSSSNSLSAVSVGSELYPMYIRRKPKNVYNTPASRATVLRVMSFGTTKPRAVESTVMITRADTAPLNTMTRGWRIAMIAAMINVSSPSSDTNIMEILDTNASLKLSSFIMLVKVWYSTSFSLVFGFSALDFSDTAPSISRACTMAMLAATSASTGSKLRRDDRI
mmetsp:Transcript_15750/g.30210  ORF Transcript_15750/g.30210 Transcript_15750/m.30210 type:complete len:263 (+) Transcript_15750:564-1352(+)